MREGGRERQREVVCVPACVSAHSTRKVRTFWEVRTCCLFQCLGEEDFKVLRLNLQLTLG